MGRIATSPFSIVFQIVRMVVLAAGAQYAEPRPGLPPRCRIIAAPPLRCDDMALRIILLASLLLACVRPPAAQDEARLPVEVQRVLAERRVPESSLSVYVREVGAPAPLVSHNATVPRNPASTMKVLTTYAALELLGPAYTWRTRAWAAGPVRDQVLDGSVVLEGGGDPFMTADRWWGFVNGLRQAGVERITGDVVIDNTLYAYQGDDRGAFDNRPYRAYNVLPDALMVNFQAVNVNVVPDAAAGAARIRVYPWPANLAVDNEVRLQRGACRGGGGLVVASPEGPTGGRLAVTGNFHTGCAPVAVTRAVMRAPEFAYGTFRTFWQQSGGTLDGGLRMGTVPADARLLYTHDSLSLAEVIRLVNKFSSNVMARHLLLTVAAEKAGRPATTAAGQRVLAEFLGSRGIAIPELVIENGSGLSRVERITALGLADVLLDAWRSPYSAEFQASLPVAAVDGTLQRRFRTPGIEGRVRMKTGNLQDVSALSGYVSSASGRSYVAVIFLNHAGADTGHGAAVQQVLVDWLYAR
jgi:D-alanyl-D-alanine carboxypeptidase/D-alanyl-D-alanine-endopeptidase (penicillin-binding protein 4)